MGLPSMRLGGRLGLNNKRLQEEAKGFEPYFIHNGVIRSLLSQREGTCTRQKIKWAAVLLSSLR